MKKKKIIIISSCALLLIILSFSLFKVLRERKHERRFLRLYGNVDIRQVDLSFRVFGRVEELFFDEGDYINTSELVATLEKTPYEEQVAQARAKLASVETELINSKIRFERREFIDPDAISREDYDDALYNEKTLQANVDEAKAALDTALTNLQDTEIFCPTNGWILTRIREPGSVVEVTEPIFTLSVESPVWIRAYVSEPNLGKIYPGMEAIVKTDAKPSPVYYGHIGFISPVAEFTPKNVETTDLRTDLVYRLRIIIDNPDPYLRQGMPVTVQLKLQDKKHKEKDGASR